MSEAMSGPSPEEPLTEDDAAATTEQSEAPDERARGFA